ncbi:helix-turn-helix domain-containing protein [Sphingobacterium sp. 2149]|uniref:helix-turn-helix domain-containing protein n=1 Tax=Sphingobacterium sp. 2149 TaxID=2817763 RepID=UPI001AE1D5DF|nr:helix-turn-helix transcriptional regulator [Sphingobacterium sp. 2149]MDR6733768.1 transcriptional regulator with XRE-family HTH domain [Sphingobacterium sp. 2149]
MKTLGKKIRLLRQQKGWTQQDVAKKLDVSIPAFSKMETGITDLNLSRLNQIAKLFNLTLVQLVSNSETDDVKDYTKEIRLLNEKLQQKGDEVIQLRKKIIALYEQLEKDNPTP